MYLRAIVRIILLTFGLRNIHIPAGVPRSFLETILGLLR